MSYHASEEEEEAAWRELHRESLQAAVGLLWNADPECEHVVVDGDHHSGIKCSKCPGWYCL